ncbi:hypothetical protein SAMN05443633_104167 [Chryseobacterium arachidis]|uniref:Uncharacterized protein n=1 Tax=Chryseobacterium arachidis TaxID=1416778 RepID=A0A1M5BH03_9FLAO|nr:hypothetical protein [Chryseobacterium arachidis]SHF41758.1 hypothetical protein SAMN05443633_104167 [Chryseobacterium arachidis]
MKVRFTKDLQNFKNLENYLVIGFGLHENNLKFYLIADDNFNIGYGAAKHFEIVDDNIEGYIRRDSLNFGREFYLENKMNDLRKDLKSYLEINNPYENVKYFEEKKYPISEEYEKKMLNEDNKLSRIEGFLLFTDHYLYEKFWDDNYRESLEFYKTKSLDYLMEKKLKDPVYINKNNYKDTLLKFIEKAFGLEAYIQEKSKYYAKTLSSFIIGLFIKEITSVQRLESFYDDCFIIEY